MGEMRVEQRQDGENRQNAIISGVIWKQLLLFALPLLIGNLFQQLYNTVDSVIVGNYVGKNALAAVGSSMSIINMLIGFFLGLSTGAGVIISQYYGADAKKELHDAVHTTIAMILISGVFLTFCGILFTPAILRMMGTPAEVMELSVRYLKIYFAGILSLMIYNMGAGILRAIGDSKRPLYYLIASSLVNVALDLIFVVCFKMGVAGVAYATIIAQTVSAVLIIIRLIRTTESYHLILRDLKIHKIYLLKILRVGLPAGLQQSIIAFSNVIVQSKINGFGAAAMAGCGAYTKVDAFVILPFMSLSLAGTTFVGQNIGARRYDRVRKTARASFIITLIITLTLSVLVYLFGPVILRIFTKEQDVIHYGSYMLKTLAPFYLFVAFANVCSGIIRGSGQTVIPMLIMVGTMCVVRVIWLTVMTPIMQDIMVVFLGYIITWVLCAALMLAYYLMGSWLTRYEKPQPR